MTAADRDAAFREAQAGVLRPCCCHGHLDGFTLEEMAALGAPCPIAAHVRERSAEAWNEGFAAGVHSESIFGGLTDESNPYASLDRGPSDGAD